MKILLINGPNLNFLGIRSTHIYGTANYETLIGMVTEAAKGLGVDLEVFQSNHEGAIIDRMQQAYHEGVAGMVINPGAFTHYSYAIADAISSVSIPTIEIHISNIYEREAFRQISVTKASCIHQIYGKGLEGYIEALEHLVMHLRKRDDLCQTE